MQRKPPQIHDLKPCIPLLLIPKKVVSNPILIETYGQKQIDNININETKKSKNNTL